MENLDPILRYFAYTATATMAGFFYWLSVENLGKRKNKFVYALLLSFFLTPVGCWVVSLIIKAKDLRVELKRLDDTAA